MEDISFWKDLLQVYGPLAIGWIVAAGLLWKAVSEKKSPDALLKAYHLIANEYHLAIVENTRTLERLSTLIEERTRAQETRLGRR